MIRLNDSLLKTYKFLWVKFGEREFSRQEALSALRENDPSLERGYIDKLTYELENAGALLKDWGTSSLDRRRSIYRLVRPEDFEEADQLEKSFAETAHQEGGLSEIIDSLWRYVREKLASKLDMKVIPKRLSNRVDSVISGKSSRKSLALVKAADLSKLSKDEAQHTAEILKLFDASGNYYRSVTNVYLEYKRMKKLLEEGRFDLRVAEFITFDGRPLKTFKEVENRKLCPICRRYTQAFKAQALITGEPKTDSVYQLYREARSQIRVCPWCFLAGYVDLPLATIRKEGQAITKVKQYLYLSSPLSRQTLKELIQKVKGRSPKSSEEEDSTQFLDEEDPLIRDLTDGEKHRIQDFPVLGTRQGLVRVEGFVLPFGQEFTQTVGISLSPEQLVALGEKVSGFVKEKLTAAMLYDLWEYTKGQVHYGRIGRGTLSVLGKEVKPEEAKLANRIYRICDRNREDFRFNPGIFELFFFNPHEAMNGILRAFTRRSESYRPRAEKIEEVIEMAEPIVNKKDWVFQWGLKLTDFLVNNRLIRGARSFHKPGGGTWSSVDLSKWLQNFKMVRDENTAREWAKRVLTALNAGNTVDGEKRPPNKETVDELMTLIEEAISQCNHRKLSLSDFSRRIANMDLYLLFYYTHKVRPPREAEEEVEAAS